MKPQRIYLQIRLSRYNNQNILLKYLKKFPLFGKRFLDLKIFYYAFQLRKKAQQYIKNLGYNKYLECIKNVKKELNKKRTNIVSITQLKLRPSHLSFFIR